MKDIDVLILCGGKGTRLKNVVYDRPKPMAEINGHPFLDIIIDYISSFGFRRFILCTGYLGKVIEHYYDKQETKKICFSREEFPLGTGGAIKNAESLVYSNPFLVLNGDSFCPADINEFFILHSAKKSLFSMLITPSIGNSKDYGYILIDKQGRITKFQEKISSVSNFVNAGIYVFDKKIFSMIPGQKYFSLENELFPNLVGNDFYGFLTKEKVIDIGTPERYEMAKELLKRRQI